MKKKLTSITFDVDLEKFRYSLIGDDYIEEEVVEMSQEELIGELKRRIKNKIEREYEIGRKMELYD